MVDIFLQEDEKWKEDAEQQKKNKKKKKKSDHVSFASVSGYCAGAFVVNVSIKVWKKIQSMKKEFTAKVRNSEKQKTFQRRVQIVLAVKKGDLPGRGLLKEYKVDGDEKKRVDTLLDVLMLHVNAQGRKRLLSSVQENALVQFLNICANDEEGAPIHVTLVKDILGEMLRDGGYFNQLSQLKINKLIENQFQQFKKRHPEFNFEAHAVCLPPPQFRLLCHAMHIRRGSCHAPH